MIYLILYIFLEVMVTSTISGEIGGLLTFAEIIFTIFLGSTILRTFKFGLMESITKVKNGEMSQEEFVKGSIGKAIGAILLMLPGFFTDILGLFLQFGIFTMVFSKIFKFKTMPKPSNNAGYSQANYSYSEFNNYNQKNNKGDDDVIDVEVIDDTKSIKP